MNTIVKILKGWTPLEIMVIVIWGVICAGDIENGDMLSVFTDMAIFIMVGVISYQRQMIEQFKQISKELIEAVEELEDEG